MASRHSRSRRRTGACVRVSAFERENADGVGLVAVAAHELVEPLIATEAYASIVAGRLEGDAHAESRSDLDTLRRGSAHARVLVEALLHQGEAAERSLRRRSPRRVRNPMDEHQRNHEDLDRTRLTETDGGRTEG
jgi:light-regulated signal transduction histidine kinase (bacteriophytochrome)